MIENYSLTEDGVIKQINLFKNKCEYDLKYVENRYNSYGEKVPIMSHIRLGFLLGVIEEPINKILDVGYGNGNFLKVCKNLINECYGNDVSDYPVPEGCAFVDNIFENEYDVICFFDSLEHFDDIEFVKNLKTKYVFISLPWCHNYSDEWFLSWKHRRPDEHFYHFNDKSLKKFMLRMGYECLKISNFEDVIRKPVNTDFNILSGIFKKI